MEQQDSRHTESEHVIDISRCNDEASSSSPISAHDRASNDYNVSRNEDMPLSSIRPSTLELSPSFSNIVNSRSSSFGRPTIVNSRSSSFGRQVGDRNRRRHSPFNSGVWISFELFLTLSQIVAAVIVLCVARHEHPHTPLFAWIIGYAAGCVAYLPLIYRRYLLRNQISDEDSAHSRRGSSTGMSRLSFSLPHSQSPESDDNQVGGSSGRRRGGQSSSNQSARVKAMIEYFKMILDCYFAIWFVLGNVWIFGGRSSAVDAPNLYRLCIVFLALSCIGYAIPFILCATICCCLPCIISVMGFREDLNQIRGATSESINALSTYKFKIKKKKTSDGSVSDDADSGVVGSGTEKERTISGEDAVCCICLAKYLNNDELRELPCTHLFHKDCVDKWLKINALCPLCKVEVGQTVLNSVVEATANLRLSDTRLLGSSNGGDSRG